MFASSSYGSPYTTGYVPQDPPKYPNGLGQVSQAQLKRERHAKAYRDHQTAIQTHNGIRETREDLLDTMGVGVPNNFRRVNNPKM
jgi:NAD(P)H-dependent flavin oxidoreductase YrpB (nitropropane dioxygenase family)